MWPTFVLPGHPWFQDDNNICSIVLENCTPYDITLERDDIIMEIEE